MAVISGTVKDVNGDFARRVVRAYRRSDGAFAAQAVSDATTGAFSCTALDASAHYALQLDGDVPEEYDPYWSNVVLAMHMDDASLSDMKGHPVTLAGGMTRSATQSKFGGYSAYFDGTDDYLALPEADFTFGTGDFTIDFFVYVDGSVNQRFLVDFRPENTNGAYPSLSMTTTNGLNFWHSATVMITGAQVIADGWHHVELSRASGVTKMFVDGTQDGSSYTDATSYGCGASRPRIGSGGYYTPELLFKGYIEDLRITKGVARHTANFTPPAAAFLHGLSIGAPTTNALIFDNITPV